MSNIYLWENYVPYSNRQQVQPESRKEVLLTLEDKSNKDPLTDKNKISKRHVRILAMLFMISDQIGDHYAGVTSIQQLIAEATNKLYPYLDIESFADDLVTRGYADCKDLEGIGKSYKIEEDGEKLVDTI